MSLKILNTPYQNNLVINRYNNSHKRKSPDYYVNSEGKLTTIVNREDFENDNTITKLQKMNFTQNQENDHQNSIKNNNQINESIINQDNSSLLMNFDANICHNKMENKQFPTNTSDATIKVNTQEEKKEEEENVKLCYFCYGPSTIPVYLWDWEGHTVCLKCLIDQQEFESEKNPVPSTFYAENGDPVNNPYFKLHSNVKCPVKCAEGNINNLKPCTKINQAYQQIDECPCCGEKSNKNNEAVGQDKNVIDYHHIINCKKNKFKCIYKECNKYIIRGQGFPDHIKYECTGFKCSLVCKKIGVTYKQIESQECLLNEVKKLQEAKNNSKNILKLIENQAKLYKSSSSLLDIGSELSLSSVAETIIQQNDEIQLKLNQLFERQIEHAEEIKQHNHIYYNMKHNIPIERPPDESFEDRLIP